jgi:hypothetical protein
LRNQIRWLVWVVSRREGLSDERSGPVNVAEAILKMVREVVVEAGVAGAAPREIFEGIVSALVRRGLSVETARMTVRLALMQEADARGLRATGLV